MREPIGEEPLDRDIADHPPGGALAYRPAGHRRGAARPHGHRPAGARPCPRALRALPDASCSRLHLTRGAGLGAAPLLRRHLDLRRPRAGPARAVPMAPPSTGVLSPSATCRCCSPGTTTLSPRATQLRAFANTCRHRGHELMPADGRRSARRPVGSSARTTRGPTRSTARSRRPPAFREVEGFERGEHSLVGCRSSAGTAGCSCMLCAPWRGPRRCPSPTTSASSSRSSRRTPRSGCVSATGTATRSRRTGRWSSRTTTSATTAR